MEREFLSVKEVAQWLGVVERTIYRMIKSKDILCYQIGGSKRFRRADIETYLESVRIS